MENNHEYTLRKKRIISRSINHDIYEEEESYHKPKKSHSFENTYHQDYTNRREHGFSTRKRSLPFLGSLRASYEDSPPGENSNENIIQTRRGTSAPLQSTKNPKLIDSEDSNDSIDTEKQRIKTRNNGKFPNKIFIEPEISNNPRIKKLETALNSKPDVKKNNETMRINDETEMDIQTAKINPDINFNSVGGLSAHLQTIQEMIILPMLYPDLYSKFNISASKGIIFHGPPGTGKTLMARALATECNNFAKQIGKKISFYVRKGSDIYSKWIGETEKNLKKLFDTAEQNKPSIIFFDEIDGFASSRNSNSDHVHNSAVATFLALLDGMESRGDIVVIGATNRLDSIDAALRRPGRFDRELLFDLPGEKERADIIKICTKKWVPSLSEEFITLLSRKTINYCGADLKEMCNQAVLNSVRTCYPQIYNSSKRLKIDKSKIYPRIADFINAMKAINPAQKSPNNLGICQSVDTECGPIRHLIERQVLAFKERLKEMYLSGTDDFDDAEFNQVKIFKVPGETDSSDAKDENVSFKKAVNPFFRTGIYISGLNNDGFLHYFIPEVLKSLSQLKLHMTKINFEDILLAADPIMELLSKLAQFQRHSPKMLIVSGVKKILNGEQYNTHIFNVFLAQIKILKPNDEFAIVLYDQEEPKLPFELTEIVNFTRMNFIAPSIDQIRKYLVEILSNKIYALPVGEYTFAEENLPEDENAFKQMSDETREYVVSRKDKALRRLRLYLRDVTYSILKERKFAVFIKPVDPNEVEDYYDIIENPICVTQILQKVDLDIYQSISDFQEDIQLIVANALEYNPAQGEHMVIRHRACDLRDHIEEFIDGTRDKNFEQELEEALDAFKALENSSPSNPFRQVKNKDSPPPPIDQDITSFLEQNNQTENAHDRRIFKSSEIESIIQTYLHRFKEYGINRLTELDAKISQIILRSHEFTMSRSDIVESTIKLFENF